MKEEEYERHWEESPMFSLETIKRDVEALEEKQPQIYSPLKEEKKSLLTYALIAAGGVVVGFTLRGVFQISGTTNIGAGWPRF